MTDSPIDSTPDEAGVPVRELADLREQPSARFVEHVLGVIDARQTTTQAVEMSWWGVTGLLMEFVDQLFRAMGLREDARDKE